MQVCVTTSPNSRSCEVDYLTGQRQQQHSEAVHGSESFVKKVIMSHWEK